MVRFALRGGEIQAEALGTSGKRELLKLQQVCHEAVVAIIASHRVLTLHYFGELAQGLPAGPAELGASAFFAMERKALHGVSTSAVRRWPATYVLRF